ncbi:DUF916 and DUF3324 domain-containing protein [Enterococcus sp. BWB1-3]|uniref:DUF916 and DUF3324 domain-containing protein n=1 Tax=unclassified Enterococcus TaxID=2608891 RepID=UPI0019210491|nr:MULTISPECIES: DUF916 and DUF3324 domain-containing protein [unclassified Enterococcus]MBL1230302.1 DUF916 and DUF3324 domain-containing protein [Enterococcus sp. BWB1-3]MCB5951343.1 DUF916 and DUF3324 domain-containing protein [Enterococcus sp. BWT-B8]
MKKNIFRILTFLYITTVAFLFSIPVEAEEAGGTQEELKGFFYKVILPENQHNPEVGYFDLRMTPGQQQTIQIQLNNSSDKEITIVVELNGAKTNSNGVIEYGPNQIEKDASLKYDFADIVKGPEEVVLPPNSQEILNLDIAMPEASFEGYISGAVGLREKDTEGLDTETDGGMIKNKFVYQTGILLSEADTEAIEPELKLNKVYPELNNFRNSVYINFSNIQPVYVNDMTVNVQIMKKNSDEVLYDMEKMNMRMAPNSLINFPVSMNGERMVGGDYLAKILVTTQAGGRWQWEQEFTISNEEAKKFNEQDLTLVQEAGINWMLILIVAGILLVVIILIFLIVRKINKKPKRNQKPRKKQPPKRNREMEKPRYRNR